MISESNQNEKGSEAAFRSCLNLITINIYSFPLRINYYFFKKIYYNMSYKHHCCIMNSGDSINSCIIEIEFNIYFYGDIDIISNNLTMN